MKIRKRFLVAFALVAGAVINAPSSSAQTSATELPQLEPGQSLGLALGITSAPNLRDVGGYETGDGSTVDRGLVYRSDTFCPRSNRPKPKRSTASWRLCARASRLMAPC